MKKILLIKTLFIMFLLIITPIASAGEPPSGSSITGPPVVGTLVLKYDSHGTFPDTYNLRASFRGCCAECFGDCKAFNVKIQTLLHDEPYLPTDITPEGLLYYFLPGRGPKNCNPIVNGVEQKDLMIETILKFDNSKDIDGDGYNDLVADIIMLYVVPPTPY